MVCLSVRLSVPFARCISVRRVCCCGPGGQQISINRGGGRALQQQNASSVMFTAKERGRTQTCLSVLYWLEVVSIQPNSTKLYPITINKLPAVFHFKQVFSSNWRRPRPTCWSTPTASSPVYMMLTQPSRDASTNNDISAFKYTQLDNALQQLVYLLCARPTVLSSSLVEDTLGHTLTSAADPPTVGGTKRRAIRPSVCLAVPCL